MSNESSTQHNDVQNSSGFARRDFLKYSTSTLAWIYLGGCNSASASAEATGYAIDSTVLTTRQRTVMLSQSFSSTILPKDLQNISAYDTSGYGVWSYGNALQAVLRTDIMSGGSHTLPLTNQPVKLLKFFAITDIHITDKESPSQGIYTQPAFPPYITSAYSPIMLYTTHVLDAAIQTVNALHKQDPIDFGISLGDVCNNTQYNETRWYIDVLDGKVITPSSGANVGANSIDYQKPYKAAGLDPAIPWYQVIGNHDHFWLGVTPLDVGDLRKTYISDEVIASPNPLANFPNINIYNTMPPLYYMGVLDGSTPTGKIIKAGPVVDFATPPKVVPDVKRRSLTKAQWAQEFFNTTTTPVGHGFNLVPKGQTAEFACYSFVPKSTLPIKVIVLDDTQSEYDGDTTFHTRGFLDQVRWNWLKGELAAGDAAGQLMIIAAHVPIGVENPLTSTADWYANTRSADMENAVTLSGLLAELHSHPNLLMWMAGHRHVNTVKAFVTDDATKPERGFWQVETSSLRDFPQQFRLFEMSLNSDYTISIAVTNVDPAVKEGTPAATSRKYAVATQQIVKTGLNPNNPNSDPTLDPSIKDPSIAMMDTNIYAYNAELLKQLSPSMATKMQSLLAVATDYSQPSHWLSVSNTGKSVDVFYLYPTAWKKGPTDPYICDIDNLSMLQGSASAFGRQATAFETDANIYAPYYRQLDVLYALTLDAQELDNQIAGIPTLDAVAAFDYYIKNYNHGRPFILAGHSQGAAVLANLLSGYLKDNSDVYNRMVAAYVIGHPVTQGYLDQNTHLKFANDANDTGVIISYNTQAPDVPSGGNPILSGLVGLVINPITWTRSQTTATTAEGLGSFMLDSTYKFVKVPQYADATVDIANGVLICSTADEDLLYEIVQHSLPRGVYHSFDFRFYYYNLRDNARNRIEKYLSK